MMTNRQTKPMVLAAYLAAIMLVLATISYYIPVFSIFAFFVLPIPMAIVYVQYGLRYTLLTGIVASVLMGILINAASAVSLLCTFGAVGICLGMGFRRQWHSFKLLMAVTLTMLITFILEVAVLQVVSGVDIQAMIASQTAQLPDMLMAQYRASGMSDVELLEAEIQVQQIVKVLPTLLPMAMCLAGSIVAYGEIRIAQLIMTRIGLSIPPFLPMRQWQIPRVMVYVYILSIVAKYWGTTREIDALMVVGLNLEQLATFAIVIQGIACILFWLNRKMTIRPVFQLLLVLLLFFEFYFFTLVIGMFDMLFQYRKRQQDYRG